MLSLERSRAHSLVHRIMSKQAAVRLNQQGIDLPPCQYITLIISVTKQPDWNHEINKFSERKQWIIAFLTAVGNLWFSIFNPLFDFHWNWNAQATSASNACEGKADVKDLGWNPYAMELRQTTQHTKKESKKDQNRTKSTWEYKWTFGIVFSLSQYAHCKSVHKIYLYYYCPMTTHIPFIRTIPVYSI